MQNAESFDPHYHRHGRHGRQRRRVVVSDCRWSRALFSSTVTNCRKSCHSLQMLSGCCWDIKVWPNLRDAHHCWTLQCQVLHRSVGYLMKPPRSLSTFERSGSIEKKIFFYFWPQTRFGIEQKECFEIATWQKYEKNILDCVTKFDIRRWHYLLVHQDIILLVPSTYLPTLVWYDLKTS